MKVMCSLLLLLVTIPALAKKDRAPLPETLKTAKTVFLSGGPPNVLDQAFDELNKWGRFQVVSDRAKADLIFEFLYISQPTATLTAYHETFIVYAATGDILYQDARMTQPSGIFTVLPQPSMARRMVKELKKRLQE